MTNKEPKELVLKTYELQKPDQMAKMAVVLKNHIVKSKLYTEISGKNYAHVEGWQFAGGLIGIFPRVVGVTNMSAGSVIKWMAEVELVNVEGKVLSTGFAVCSNAEVKKKSFDEYAVLSMAQTRAIGKAYRNMLGWVMKLAGYEGTPSEEMTKMGEKVPEPREVTIQMEETELKKGQVIGPDGKPTYTCSKCDDPISDAEANYSQKMFGKKLCRADQKGAKKK